MLEGLIVVSLYTQVSHCGGWVQTAGTAPSTSPERCHQSPIHQWTRLGWGRHWSGWSVQRYKMWL